MYVTMYNLQKDIFRFIVMYCMFCQFKFYNILILNIIIPVFPTILCFLSLASTKQNISSQLLYKLYLTINSNVSHDNFHGFIFLIV